MSGLGGGDAGELGVIMRAMRSAEWSWTTN